jgi:hypothetical protein
MIFPLNIPEYEHEVKQINGLLHIFDVVRRKYVALQPEEWVRQQFIRWMLEAHQYPKALISVEALLMYHQRPKRSDIVVYDRQGKAFLLVECKAPHIALSKEVIHQALTYNSVIQAPYISITNGHFYSIFQLQADTRQFVAIEQLPLLPD